MKKLLIAISAAIFLSSCVTGTRLETSTAPADKNSYTILKEDKTATARNKIWILFIPIGIGPKGEEKREARCLNRMLKQNDADGIVSGKYVHKKIIVPLILFTYSHRNTVFTATTYKLNTDTLKKH